QAGGDGRGAPVDPVEAVRIHVIREPAGAADARHEHDLLPRDVQLGHQLLHRGQDGEVAAARAPAHFLVGDEVLLRQLHDGRAAALDGLAHADTSCCWPGRSLRARASMALFTSATWNGLPFTLFNPTVSNPSCPRRWKRSWPRFIS